MPSQEYKIFFQLIILHTVEARSDNDGAIFSGKDDRHLQLLANYKKNNIKTEEEH